MKLPKKLLYLLAAGLLVPLAATLASEDEHDEKDEHRAAAASERPLETIEDLRAEVRELREAVRALQASQPTITSLMPDFAERFHVMHYAGDAGDWAVATHEMLEMQRMMGVMAQLNPEYGSLMQGFMGQSFKQLNAAMEHDDRDAFAGALAQAVENCNACHAAAGSDFIDITLDVEQSLSMRHPHRLQASEKPGEHTHTH